MSSPRIYSAPAVLNRQPEEGDVIRVTGKEGTLGVKVSDITEENLEDFLAYDDLFLDYFNAFLSLPVFAQPLYYNRLTGTFVEVNGSANTLSGSVVPPDTPLYGATDEERERMLEWAREERLPLFLRTQLFREFKLCKLLLRPLDDRGSASRLSSRQIRGYSRQTESYVSSLSNSADNSANDADLDEDAWGEIRRSALYKYARPGSRAFSLPARLGLARSFSQSASSATGITRDTDGDVSQATQSHPAISTCSAKTHSRQQVESVSGTAADSRLDAKTPARTTREGTNVSFHVDTKDGDFTEEEIKSKSLKSSAASERRSGSKSGQRSSSKSSRRSVQSGGSSRGSRGATPVTGRRTMSSQSNRENHPPTTQSGERTTDEDPASGPAPFLPDFDATFGEDEPEPKLEPFVAFADVVSDQQTEVDVRTLEGKHKMSLQQMKEQVLGTYEGMDQFRGFLCNVLGGHLLAFWLDCEEFKDMMEDYDEEDNNLIRSRLFRDIRDKHRLSLTAEARQQLAKAACNSGLSHTIFIRAQYDVLRRLRAYWVPRFLVHKERMDELSVELRPEAYLDMDQQLPMAEQSQCTSFFPSISLVNSMPVRPEDAVQIAKTTNWESVSKGGRKFDERVKSAKPNTRRRHVEQSLREKLILALMADKAAGGPFRMFLERHQDHPLLSILSFWEDVTEYGQAEDRSADRLLRMVRAWDIFNTFVSDDSRCSIGVSPDERDKLHQILLLSTDFVDSSIFEVAKQHAVDQMEVAWIRYLKEDMKAFIDCHIRAMEPPPDTAEEIEVYFDERGTGRMVVRRPRPWVMRYPPSTSSERGQRLRTALSVAESIDEVRRAEQRRKAREKRKITERERKKAVRNARRRQREAKMRKNVSFEGQGGSNQGGGEGVDGELGAGQQEQSNPTFQESYGNKQVMTIFRKYMSETEGRETTNPLNLFMDIETYHSLADSKVSKPKKDTQAHYIHKTYLDQGARKKVNLSDRVYARLKTEKDRPKTPTLREIQQGIQPLLEEQFQNFLESSADELGLGDNKSLANLSKIELAMRSDDPALMSSWKKRGKLGKSWSASNSLGSGKSGSRGSRGSRGSIGSRGNRQTPPTQPPLPPQSPEPDPSALESSNIPQSILKLKYSNNDFKMARKKRNVQISQRVDSSAEGDRPGTEAEASNSQEGTPSESRQQSRQPRRKSDGRAQPTKEDKVEFMVQLNNAAMGQLPLQMLYFYKYLVKYREDGGCPLIDRDLFFYCEVQKFKSCNHAFSDEEMLKRKVSSIVDSFLDSHPPPALQIDVPNEVQQKALRAAQKYMSGKDLNSQLFDEAQFCVFKELLPFWAGFMRHHKTPEDGTRRPLTKLEKERLKRLEEMIDYNPPEAKKFSLPHLPRGTQVAAFTFTLNEGVKWRDGAGEENGPGHDRTASQADSQASRLSRTSLAGAAKQRRVSLVSNSITGGLGSRQSTMATRVS